MQYRSLVPNLSIILYALNIRMLHIKNKGATKTFIHKNGKNKVSKINWDADYDGENANLSLDMDENGKKGHIEMKINNDELAELLNIPSENNMLDKRLYKDLSNYFTDHTYNFFMTVQDMETSNLSHFMVNDNDPVDGNVSYNFQQLEGNLPENVKTQFLN
jgi:hypothetical protein